MTEGEVDQSTESEGHVGTFASMPSTTNGQLDLLVYGPWPQIAPKKRHLRSSLLWTAKRLAARSELLRFPPNGSCGDYECYIRAVGCLVAASRHKPERGGAVRRLQVAEANFPGQIHRDHEVYFFGRWLLLDDHPGFSRPRGRAPDELSIFRTVAVVVAELNLGDMLWDHQHLMRDEDIKPVKPRITRTDLSNRWLMLFAEKPSTGTFRNRMPAARRYVESYLEHIDKLVGTRRSRAGLAPVLRSVLHAIDNGAGV